MNFDFLITKIPMAMEEKNIKIVTDFKQVAIALRNNESKMSDNELKTVNLIRVNLLECILKELVIVKTKKMEVLEELHITSLITNYFISEPALIRVKNFIKETEGFSLSVSVGDAREYEAMQLFQYDIKKIINAYAYQLYLEIQHGHLRSDTTVNGAN